VDIPEHQMKRISYIIISVLIPLLTSCGFGGRIVMPDEDLASNHIPEEVWITYDIKSEDVDYKPWDYVNEIACGWSYDPWMNDFEDMNVCTYECVERPKYDHIKIFYPTWERCMYFDYKQ